MTVVQIFKRHPRGSIMAEATEEIYVQASFFTKEQKNAIDDIPFSLPLSSTRNDLSSLLCQILSDTRDTEVALDFDFLVNGILLRKTLKELTDLLPQLESVVQVEYVQRNPPPSLDNELPHNDWVSAVQCSNDHIISGSYDDNVRIWDYSGELIVKCPGHEGKISDVALLPKSHDDHMTFLSSSHDQHIHIWSFNQKTNEVELKVICKGHSRSVEAISIDPNGDKFISGSWDKMLKIWSTSVMESNEVEEVNPPPVKRTHFSTVKSASSRVPIATLAGHTHPINCLVWPEESEFYSAGYDHCIRVWDMPTGVNKNIINGSKVFLDIDKRKDTHLIATGHTDKHIRIWDTRCDGPSIVACTLSSHYGWVKNVRWSPLVENQLVSGCYDNSARLWDTRSPKVPLYTISAHNGKVLCLDWSNPQVIATGGADNMLRTFKTNNNNNN